MKALRHILYIYIVGMLVACSTTSHLPEGEVLYTGIKKTKVHDKHGTAAEDLALA